MCRLLVLLTTAVAVLPVSWAPAGAQIGNGTLSIEVSEEFDTTPMTLDVEPGEEVMFYAAYDDPDPFATPTTGDFDFGDGSAATFGNVYEGCATPQIWVANEAIEVVPAGARPTALGALRPIAAARHVYSEPGTYTVSARAFVERHECGLFEGEAEWVEATLTVVVG